MESFRYKDKEIVFWNITGEVISQSKRSETHIYSSGGDGYIHGSGGYVHGHINAPTIHSNVITKHEFWIKKEDGKEESIQLSGCDIPIREGQKVTLIIAGNRGANDGRYVSLINHTTGKYWFIENSKSLNRNLKIDFINFTSLKSILIFIVAISAGIALPLLFLVYIYLVINRYGTISKLNKDLDRHLESLVRSVRESHQY